VVEVRVLLVALLLPLAEAAPCEAPVPGDQLVALADDAQAAFSEMDGGGFDAAVQGVEAGVPCLDAPLSPAQAGRVHMTLGLDGYLARDTARSVRAFQAAQAADPALDPSSWLPETHPLHQEWRFAQGLAAAAPDDIAPPDGVRVFADGVVSKALHTTRPAVLQRVEGDRVDSLLWRPGEPLPAWTPPAPTRLSASARRHIWLGSGTLALAGATTGLLIASDALHDRYVDERTAYGELAELETGVRTTSTAAIVAGSVGLGLATTLVVTW
jgi:hypothetical protein